MRITAFVATSVLALATAAALATNGCTSDEPKAARPSRRGEACRATNDCSDGLACVPVPGGAIGVCTLGSFGVAATAKECAVLECEEASDCCGPAPPNCSSLLTTCTADAGEISRAACAQYDQQCRCDAARAACEQNKCVRKCTDDVECATSPSGRRCSGGRCVQCSFDDECGPDRHCANGVCQAACRSDGDCAGFDRCVSGRCVQSGCQTDRECIAATRNVEATCGTDGKCVVPCQTDLECGDPRGYAFFSCIEHACVYTGCQTDKDCRLLLTGPSDAGALPANQHVVCREPLTPGAPTRPPL